MRLACLWVPNIGLQAMHRANPELARSPVAVVEGYGSSARVMEASQAARAQGVLKGQLLSDALGLAPHLQAKRLPPSLLDCARSAIADAAAQVSPRVEVLNEALFRALSAWVDTEGLSGVWKTEQSLANALLVVARRMGFEGRVGVASGKRICRLAAARSQGIEIVPLRQERLFLAGLPVEVLGPSAEMLETLQRWGIATAGQLAALPVDGVGARLGKEGVALHRLANGEDEEPFIPMPLPERFEESCDVDFSIVTLEAFAFLLRPALERLIARLEARGLACAELTLHLRLDPVGEVVRQVELAGATRETKSLLALCRAALEREPPPAPVVGLKVIARPAEVRRAQLGLWELPSVAPMKLMATVAEVASIVGADRVGRAALVDSHLPESHLEPFEAPPPRSQLDPKAASLSEAVAAVRLFRPPLSAEVRLGPQGPESLCAHGVNGWVVSCAGPRRIDVDWHRSAKQQDVFDLQLSDGAVYRVAQLGTGRWLILGRYD